MSATVSKRTLETVILHGLAVVKKPTYEAYGRKVSAYLSVPEGVTREGFARALELKGCKVSRSYAGNALEITNMGYFKAKGWDE